MKPSLSSMCFADMAWSLIVVAAAVLLLPDSSAACSIYGLPKGTKTIQVCAEPSSQLEHGSTEHLPKPVVRPDDYIIENYGNLDQRLELTVTLVSASLSDWMQEEIINHDNVTVEIYYTYSEYCGYISCPDAKKLTCVVEAVDSRYNYTFVAVNVSDKGNWKTHCLGKLQLLPRAKAAMVEDFKVIAVNSSTVIVTWEGTVLNEGNTPVQYWVKFNGNNFRHQVERVYNGTPPNRKYQHLISGLIPDGVYDVTIIVQPVTWDAAKTPTGFPSAPVSCSITMPEDVPVRNPYWAPGKFSIGFCQDGCKTTSVTIYWQALPEISRNGVIHYVVTVKKITNSSTRNEVLHLKENVTATRSSYQIKDLLKRPIYYKIELVAATAKGINSSAYPSVIYLDGIQLASSPRPSHVESVKASNHASILVTWEGAQGSNYSVVLCREGENDQLRKCKGQLWSLAVGNATSMKVPLGSAEGKERYRVGVWEDDGSGGIVWSPCVSQEGVSPKSAPPANIYSQIGHLVVKVGHYSCEDSAAPSTSLKYHVNYCVTVDNKTCSGEVSNKMIGPDKLNQQFLYAVEPNHFYKVTIYAESDGGRRSPKLVENHFVPMSTKGQTIGAILGGVLAALLIIGVIVSLLIYRNHVNTFPIPILIEKVPIVTLSMEPEDGENPYEELHEEDLMIRRVELNNHIEDCVTDEEELEQVPAIGQMQPMVSTEEEELPEEIIDDYAVVTFNTKMPAAPRFVVDQPNESEFAGAQGIQMAEPEDNSGDKWTRLYDDTATDDEDDTDSDCGGDSVISPERYSGGGVIFKGNDVVKWGNGGAKLKEGDASVSLNGENSSVHDSCLHSNGPGVNTTESDSGLHSNGVNSNEKDLRVHSNGVNSYESDSGLRSSVKSNEEHSGLPLHQLNSNESDSGLRLKRSNSNESDSGLRLNRSNSNESDSDLRLNRLNSIDEDSGVHSNSVDSCESDSTMADLDLKEDYSKFWPSETKGRTLMPCTLTSPEVSDSASPEESCGSPNARTCGTNVLVKEGIKESGLGSNFDGSTLSGLPPLHDDFMID